MSPGYKTSEFWLSLAAVGVSALQACGAFGDSSWEGKLVGLGAALLSALGYTVSRTWLKAQ
jgi:hypothetical protein